MGSTWRCANDVDTKPVDLESQPVALGGATTTGMRTCSGSTGASGAPWE
jgi:hypothetical protein